MLKPEGRTFEMSKEFMQKAARRMPMISTHLYTYTDHQLWFKIYGHIYGIVVETEASLNARRQSNPHQHPGAYYSVQNVLDRRSNEQPEYETHL